MVYKTYAPSEKVSDFVSIFCFQSELLICVVCEYVPTILIPLLRLILLIKHKIITIHMDISGRKREREREKLIKTQAISLL